MKTAKAQYDCLSNAEKDKYIESAAQAKALYNENLKQWEEKMMRSGYNVFVRQRTLQGISQPESPPKKETTKVE